VLKAFKGAEKWLRRRGRKITSSRTVPCGGFSEIYRVDDEEDGYIIVPAWR
jgi:hypothetical protein